MTLIFFIPHAAKVLYKMTLVTANYHGFDPDSDVDPVWMCVFGDKGNTGDLPKTIDIPYSL